MFRATSPPLPSATTRATSSQDRIRAADPDISGIPPRHLTIHQPEAPAKDPVPKPHQPEAQVLNLRHFVNREAMAGTSPGRQSGETAKSERHRVPKGRPAEPDKISVVPSGLWGVCCSLTMDLRPWLSHVMPSAFKSASEGLRPETIRTRSASEGLRPQTTPTRSASEGSLHTGPPLCTHAGRQCPPCWLSDSTEPGR